jgi:hypothetical protein
LNEGAECAVKDDYPVFDRIGVQLASHE